MTPFAVPGGKIGPFVLGTPGTVNGPPTTPVKRAVYHRFVTIVSGLSRHRGHAKRGGRQGSGDQNGEEAHSAHHIPLLGRSIRKAQARRNTFVVMERCTMRTAGASTGSITGRYASTLAQIGRKVPPPIDAAKSFDRSSGLLLDDIDVS